MAVSATSWDILLGETTVDCWPDHRCGRRDVLRTAELLYVISAPSCTLGSSIASFFVCRFIAGLAIGSSSVSASVSRASRARDAAPRASGSVAREHRCLPIARLRRRPLCRALRHRLGGTAPQNCRIGAAYAYIFRLDVNDSEQPSLARSQRAVSGNRVEFASPWQSRPTRRVEQFCNLARASRQASSTPVVDGISSTHSIDGRPRSLHSIIGI